MFCLFVYPKYHSHLKQLQPQTLNSAFCSGWCHFSFCFHFSVHYLIHNPQLSPRPVCNNTLLCSASSVFWLLFHWVSAKPQGASLVFPRCTLNSVWTMFGFNIKRAASVFLDSDIPMHLVSAADVVAFLCFLRYTNPHNKPDETKDVIFFFTCFHRKRWCEMLLLQKCSCWNTQFSFNAEVHCPPH